MKYKIPTQMDGQIDLTKVVHDIKSSLAAIDTAYRASTEKCDHGEENRSLYKLAFDRLMEIVSAMNEKNLKGAGRASTHVDVGG